MAQTHRASSGPVAEVLLCAHVALKNWILAVPEFVLTTAILGVLVFAGGGPLLGFLLTQRSFDATIQPSWFPGPGFFVIMFLAVFVGTIFSIAISATVCLGANEALEERPIDLPVLFKSSWTYFWTIVLFGIVIGIVWAIVSFVVGLLVTMTGGALQVIVPPLDVCLVVALTYSMMFATPAIVLGNQKATDAMITSWDFAFGNIGRVLPTAIVLGILTVIVTGMDLALRYVPWLGIVLAGVLSLLVGLVQTVTIVKMYRELRATEPAIESP
jgi:hypothetical protein